MKIDIHKLDNVVHIGDFSIARKQRSYWKKEGECLHRRFQMEEDGEIVRCSDCKVQVSAWWMLNELLSAYRDSNSSIKRREERLKEQLEKNLTLLAAQMVEKAWRSRRMVPSCPHCYRGILATDRLGASAVNKEIELARRKTERKWQTR